MLGHKLAQHWAGRFEVWVTFRGSASEYQDYGFFDLSRAFSHVDASSSDTLVRAVGAVKPDTIVNCIGVIKQLPTAVDPLISIETNSLFPHRLVNLAAAAAARVVHISTDCVFSGSRGAYSEDDSSDAQDRYGRTKYLGEISGPGALTLRTSIIGREIRTTSGLVEWFLSQKGRTVKGWRRAIYSGLTTQALARIMAEIVERQPQLHGLYHVASEPISKYELLCRLRDVYRLDVKIEPDDGVQIDRSLDGSRFRTATGLTVPSWADMLSEMARDPTPYDQWRRHAS